VLRKFGNRPWEARTLDSLGRLLDDKGDPTGARQAWHGALAILQELGMPEATEVAAWLEC
jgi:hypothetical protein